MDISFDADTGVMRHLRQTEYENNVLISDFELQREDVSQNDGNTNSSSGAGLPLPAPGFVWIIPALIAIPFIKRK